MEASQPAQSAQIPLPQPAAEMPADLNTYTWVLGLTAAMFALLHVLIAGSAAVAGRAAIITTQRSLIDYAHNGGVSIDLLVDPLLRLFFVTYLTAIIAMGVILGFCWYAGRVAAEHDGSASRAGAKVALVSALVWFVIGIPAVLLTHADGTISWLLATFGVIIFAPKAPPLSSVYMTSPNGQFLLLEVAALLLQLIPLLLLTVSFGALAAQIGGYLRRGSQPR